MPQMTHWNKPALFWRLLSRFEEVTCPYSEILAVKSEVNLKEFTTHRPLLDYIDILDIILKHFVELYK